MTPNKEDYLKLILNLNGDQTIISNKQIVQGLHVSPSSVSEMLVKLDKEGLITYTPYKGAQLTQAGILAARKLVRYHRLWEVFLTQCLDYDWSEVHHEAERLEHVTSETLADRLDQFLKQPTHCPHGSPIPDHHLRVPYKHSTTTLRSLSAPQTFMITHVIDDPHILSELTTYPIQLNTPYILSEIKKDTYIIEDQLTHQSWHIPKSYANYLFVQSIHQIKEDATS